MKRTINGANSKMVTAITGKTIREEATEGSRTFDAVSTIRATRLKWLDCILRMGPGRMVHIAVKKLYASRLEGDLLMDAPASTSWSDLVAQAKKEKSWRAEVRKIKDMMRIEVGKGAKTNKQNVKKAGAAAIAGAKTSKGKKTKERKRTRKDTKTIRTGTTRTGARAGDVLKPKRAHRQIRELIRCNDGFTMSVQASRGHFCSPRNDVGPYDGVEVGYPSMWEDLLLPHTDNNTDLTPAICGMTSTPCVNAPPHVISAVIRRYVGLAHDNGRLSPMIDMDENGSMWAAAAVPPSDSEEHDTEEEDEGCGSPSSMVYLVATPTLPPPPQPHEPPPPVTSTTTTYVRTGELTPPQSLQDTVLSPIEK